MPITLRIVTPKRQVFEGNVDSVTAPGVEGEFGVLPGHTPFITTLLAGELVFELGGKPQYYAISDGYIEVSEDRMIVLAENVERADEIDLDRAKRAQQKAEQALKAAEASNDQFERARIKLLRSLTRQKVGSRRM